MKLTRKKAQKSFDAAVERLSAIAESMEVTPAQRRTARQAIKQVTADYGDFLIMEIEELTAQYASFIADLEGVIEKIGETPNPVAALEGLKALAQAGAELFDEDEPENT